MLLQTEFAITDAIGGQVEKDQETDFGVMKEIIQIATVGSNLGTVSF